VLSEVDSDRGQLAQLSHNFVAWSLLSLEVRDFHHEIADATQVIVFEVEGEEVFKPSVAVQLRLLELRL